MDRIDIQKAFDKFKPEACVFVVSVDKKGKPSGMIAGWRTRCSRDPVMYAVSLSLHGHTHKLIHESGEFVIAVPNKDLVKEVEFFGSKTGAKVDKFKQIGLEMIPAKYIRTPLIKKATLNFECQVIQEIRTGDHVTFISKILAAYINKNKKILMNMGKIGNKRIYKEF
jgi:flavin reductase (DIM6/NTAB) family NADH-FMN oxidoreductase RutF